MNIKDIENHIDRVWENLPIYRFPLHLALFMVLSILEAQNLALRELFRNAKVDEREVAGGLTHTKDGLEMLIPQILKKCAKSDFKEKDIKILRGLRRTSFLHAHEASIFSQRYAWFAYHIMSYYQNWLTCSVDGRVLTFSDPKNTNVGSSLMHHALHRFHEELHVDEGRPANIYMHEQYRDTIEEARLALRHKNIRELLYSISPSMLNYSKGIVDAHSPRPSIQEDLVFETYSISDYYRFWKHLSALMLCYLEVCKFKYRLKSDRLLSSMVLVLTPDEIVNAVASSEEVSIDTCSNIVKDFTLDTHTERPDVKVRYIVPVQGSNYVYLSPTLVFTSSWEVCLFRNWAKLSHNRYGAVIASKKSKLADQLAKQFISDEVITVVRRTIVSPEQGPLGDIDLAVFDKESGYLAIVELKWLLPADSFQEHSHAREEISNGIKQLKRIMNQYERDSSFVLKQLFDKQSIETGMVTEVQYFLICDCHIAHYGEAENLSISMLDYQLCSNSLKMHVNDPVKERFKKAIDSNLAYVQACAQDLCHHTMKIAGYAFRTPGLRMVGRQHIEQPYDRTVPLPKSPCYCGSGIAYRDCCQLVESIEERPIDYVQ